MKYLRTYPDRCTGCLSCESVCSKTFFKDDDREKSAIRVGPGPGGGFLLEVCDQKPRLCVMECPTRAISVNRLGVVVVNKGLCVSCYACVAACPLHAMRRKEGVDHPFKCVACGACAKACPSNALEIVTEEERP